MRSDLTGERREITPINIRSPMTRVDLSGFLDVNAVLVPIRTLKSYILPHQNTAGCFNHARGFPLCAVTLQAYLEKSL